MSSQHARESFCLCHTTTLELEMCVQLNLTALHGWWDLTRGLLIPHMFLTPCRSFDRQTKRNVGSTWSKAHTNITAPTFTDKKLSD